MGALKGPPLLSSRGPRPRQMHGTLSVRRGPRCDTSPIDSDESPSHGVSPEDCIEVGAPSVLRGPLLFSGGPFLGNNGERRDNCSSKQKEQQQNSSTGAQPAPAYVMHFVGAPPLGAPLGAPKAHCLQQQAAGAAELCFIYKGGFLVNRAPHIGGALKGAPP